MTSTPSTTVSYRREGDVGWIDVDDGKVNALSLTTQQGVADAFDRALTDDVVTVLRGRTGVFSAGFDLSSIAAADRGTADMIIGGFTLARRVLGHPRPVLVACTGHAIAMGLFLVQSGDYRLGSTAPARFTANEVAIGLTLPLAATELLRQRLTPAAFPRAALLSETFDPPAAVAAGLLDEIVEPDLFDLRTREIAEQLTRLDPVAHRETKAHLRADALAAIDRAIDEDRRGLEQRLAEQASGSG